MEGTQRIAQGQAGPESLDLFRNRDLWQFRKCHKHGPQPNRDRRNCTFDLVRSPLKSLVAIFFFLAASLPAVAVEGGQVMYAGGTVPGVNQGVAGRLDTSSRSALIFEYPGTRVSIPYATIDSFEYSQEVTHHVGVLPAIAIGLIKQRKRRHFFRISYHDERSLPQVAIFEVSKHTPRSLQAVLEVRAPQVCKPYTTCHALQ